MTSFSFTGSAGLFTLPLTNGPPKYAVHFTDDKVQTERSTGSYTAQGTGMAPLSYGTIDATFVVTPDWLESNGYSNDIPGAQSACADFSQFVVGGGLGMLTEGLPSGYRVGKGGPTATSRTCTARIEGDPEYDPQEGGTVVEIVVQFVVPSGYWTYSSGTVLPLSY